MPVWRWCPRLKQCHSLKMFGCFPRVFITSETPVEKTEIIPELAFALILFQMWWSIVPLGCSPCGLIKHKLDSSMFLIKYCLGQRQVWTRAAIFRVPLMISLAFSYVPFSHPRVSRRSCSVRQFPCVPRSEGPYFAFERYLLVLIRIPVISLIYG